MIVTVKALYVQRSLTLQLALSSSLQLSLLSTPNPQPWVLNSPRVTWAKCCQGPEDHRNEVKPKPPTECHPQIRPHCPQDPRRVSWNSLTRAAFGWGEGFASCPPKSGKPGLLTKLIWLEVQRS